jgi:hypothetical protein
VGLGLQSSGIWRKRVIGERADSTRDRQANDHLEREQHFAARSQHGALPESRGGTRLGDA